MGAAFPGATQDPFGGMTPADALGGGLAQTDPATGRPYGQTDIIDPATGLPRGYVQGQGFAPQPKPNELSLPGPAEQPQAFPNLMQNPAFNPIVQQPQQLQNIAQGQPTLVNQLTPPAPGPGPGSSITQVPPPFPNFGGDNFASKVMQQNQQIAQQQQQNFAALPQAQQQQRLNDQASFLKQQQQAQQQFFGGPASFQPFPTPPRVNMDFLRQPGMTPPPAMQTPFPTPPRVNMDFLRQPPPNQLSLPGPENYLPKGLERLPQPSDLSLPGPVPQPAPQPAPKFANLLQNPNFARPNAPRPVPQPAPRPAPRPAPQIKPKLSPQLQSRLNRLR